MRPRTRSCDAMLACAAESTLFVSSLAGSGPARRVPECRQRVCTSLEQTNRHATHPKGRQGGLPAGSRAAPAVHADGGNVGDHGFRPESLPLVRLAPISSPLPPPPTRSHVPNLQFPRSSPEITCWGCRHAFCTRDGSSPHSSIGCCRKMSGCVC